MNLIVRDLYDASGAQLLPPQTLEIDWPTT
jgi:hypothetical protein